MITVENLTKSYGKKRAVDDLSFTVRSGAVTGFLGPNGSGKSTTMRCMVGLDSPNNGHALFDGVEYSKLSAPLSKVGSLLDGKAFHPGRSARQHLTIVAQTHGIPQSRVDEVLTITGIDSVAKKKLKGFSLGMGQRLGIAVALLGDPEVLILDEPVNGLDPDGVRWVRQLMRNFAAEGRTVLVSSHLMSEMALTADDLVIIGRGKLIASGPIRDFTETASNRKIKVAGPDALAIENVLRTANVTYLMNQPAEHYPTGYLEISGSDRMSIGHLLYENNVEIHELTETYSSLEDVFMELTDDDVDYRVDTKPNYTQMGN
ncbi:ABC transporter ATP-binding protein [Arcanobacterium ihumii]|uniref:ABC transporter ATP-binding protein n=1 Tax=Arcanobacterium ihumii TaxID=2138162 RepID=UPI000F537029|nr:ABC transporter ATP-binding protein [Arcanobacterium ihumii]